ncbi:MAG: putative lipid II flippase FtsW [Coriobacteriales bacterium]|nr:putative lipid II flippase FtsW [Coriobacteriales bacterium]
MRKSSKNKAKTKKDSKQKGQVRPGADYEHPDKLGINKNDKKKDSALFFKGDLKRYRLPRYFFVIFIFLLTCFGLVMIFSSSSGIGVTSDSSSTYTFLIYQLLAVLLGSVICVIAAAIPYYSKFMINTIQVLSIIFIIILIAIMFTPGDDYGVKRRIEISFLAFQPSEFAKILIVCMAAQIYMYYSNGTFSWKRAGIFSLIFVLAPLLLILIEPDLGSFAILFVAIIGCLVFSGLNVKIVIIILIAIIAVGLIAVFALPYTQERIATFLSPTTDTSGKAYQITNSYAAFGSGGFFGTGIGTSRQKYGWQTQPHTDFIFSIIGEELGFIGCFCLILLFAGFIFCGIMIAKNAKDRYASAIAGGLTILIGFQAFVNMGMEVGFLPVTGKTLPFISYGASSIVSTLGACGLILSVSIYSNESAASKLKRDEFVIISQEKNQSDNAGTKSKQPAPSAGLVGSIGGIFTRSKQNKASDNNRYEKQTKYSRRSNNTKAKNKTSRRSKKTSRPSFYDDIENYQMEEFDRNFNNSYSDYGYGTKSTRSNRRSSSRLNTSTSNNRLPRSYHSKTQSDTYFSDDFEFVPDRSSPTKDNRDADYKKKNGDSNYKSSVPRGRLNYNFYNDDKYNKNR